VDWIHVWIAGGVKPVHLVAGKDDSQSSDIFFELFFPARSNDRQDGRNTLTHPGDDHLIGSATQFCGNLP
jgi:hypothetical protein